MTQAEFARAAGWSTSTISSWERGSKQPSRVAFKTILAFAEAHGVRYQPKADASSAPATETLPVLRLGSRLPTPTVAEPIPVPVSVLDGGREESFGSRRWTEIAAHGAGTAFERARPIAERPEWQIDARVQVRVGAGAEQLRRTGYVVASLVALVIGAATGLWLRSGTGTHATTSRASDPIARAAAPVADPAPKAVPPVQVDELALAAVVAPPLPGPPLAAGQGAAPSVEPASAVAAPSRLVPPALARLESIVSLDGIRRATFRVGDRSIALVEGDDIGGRTVALIGRDEVSLVGGGVAERVRLGFDTPLH